MILKPCAQDFNICLSANGQLLVIDFGSAAWVKEDKETGPRTRGW